MKFLVLCILIFSSTSYASNEWNFGGELEVFYTNNDGFSGGPRSSDIVQGSFELGAEVLISEGLSGEFSFSYEEDRGDRFSEPYSATIKREFGRMHIIAGKMDLPFGAHETEFINDSLSLEFGEFNDTAIVFGVAGANYQFDLFVSNGEVNVANESDHPRIFGMNLDYFRTGERTNVTSGVSYISDIADSTGFEEVFLGTGALSYTEAVAAYGVDLNFQMGSTTLIVEYISAVSEFASTDFTFNGVGAKPTFYKMELVQAIGHYDLLFLYEKTSQAVGISVPETTLGVGVKREVEDSQKLGVEYTMSDDYGVSDGGSGKSGSAITVGWSVEV